MTEDHDLFDRPKALRCFGSEAILQQVLQEFLQQVDPMLGRLREALEKADHQEVRKTVHWFRGGLSYLFSPAAERVCLDLEKQTAHPSLREVGPVLSQLEGVMQRLQEHVR